jgi:hypothetical protein
LIYSGQEAGFDRRLRFFDKDTIDWNNYKLSAFYSTLIRLKKENKALWNGTAGGALKRIETGNHKEIYAFLREKEGNKVLVILNLSSAPVDVNLQDHAIIGAYKNVFTGETLHFEGTAKLSLTSWEYLVFSKKIN